MTINCYNFQNILNKLYEFWTDFNCLAIPSAQTEISSPIFHPVSFFNLIRDKNIQVIEGGIEQAEKDGIKVIIKK